MTAEEILDGSASAADGDAAKFTDVVIATGVVPRIPDIPGIDHPMVMSYAEAVLGQREIGKRVAVIGAGGIGFDVSEFLTTDESPTLNLKEWEQEWGVSEDLSVPGFVTKPRPLPATRQVCMVQRKPGGQGKTLGKTTGWVHRATVKMKGVEQISGATYDLIDDEGLHLTLHDKEGNGPASESSKSTTSSCARARIGARPRRPAHRRRCHDPRDRWRRPRLGPRREARPSVKGTEVAASCPDATTGRLRSGAWESPPLPPVASRRHRRVVGNRDGTRA